MAGSTSPAMARPRCQGQPPAPGSSLQLAQPCHKSTRVGGAAFQSQLGVTAARNAEQKGSASHTSPPSSRVSQGCGGQEQPMAMDGAAPPLPHSHTRGQGHSRTARRSCAHPQHTEVAPKLEPASLPKDPGSSPRTPGPAPTFAAALLSPDPTAGAGTGPADCSGPFHAALGTATR